MDKLHIKCTCGRNEQVTEAQVESLPWLEDQSLKCHCGKKLPYKGYAEVKRFGTAWITSQ